MKSVFVNEKTLDGAWFTLLSELYKHGRNNHIDAGSFAGANRLEFDFASGTIEFPTTRPLAPIMPDGVPPVTTEEAIEAYFANYIMDGDNLAKNEHYRYATFINGGDYHLPVIKYHVIRDGVEKRATSYAFKIKVPSQVQWLIDHYKKAGYGNNHCYIQVGYPESSLGYDMPFTSEADRQTSPCLRGIDTAVKDNVLHMSVVFRSWDLYAGFPENMGGITMLGEYIANELGIKMGPLSFSCLKLHCYSHQIEAMKARLKVS